MNNLDKQYKELINKILENGINKIDRTGVGTKSIFGHQMKFKMNDGFPILTLRKIHIKSIIHELLWILSSYDEKYEKFGNTNIRYLLDNGVTFWTEWPYKEYLNRMKYSGIDIPLNIKEYEYRIKNDDDFAIDFGSIGPGYGEQWINSGSFEMIENIENEVTESDDDVRRKTKRKITKIEGVNQIDNVIETLKKNPDSRRIIVDAWNPSRIDEMLLPPCHMMFQFYSFKMNGNQRYEEYKKWIKENNHDEILSHRKGYKIYNFPDRYLSLQLYIRSNDCYLGLPFNISEYSLLLHMVSQVVNMIPYEFIYTIGDAHLYNNSIDAAKEICKRDEYSLSKLTLNKNIKSIYDFRYNDIKIENYKSHPNIKVDVAV